MGNIKLYILILIVPTAIVKETSQVIYE